MDVLIYVQGISGHRPIGIRLWVELRLRVEIMVCFELRVCFEEPAVAAMALFVHEPCHVILAALVGAQAEHGFEWTQPNNQPQPQP